MPDWDPEQYRRFAAERAQPFHDLLALIEPGGIRTAVDLGCGPGELTALAAQQLGVDQTVGLDSSPAMLARAAAFATSGLRFIEGDLAGWTGAGVDLVIAAASLHWVPDHREVLARWRGGLAPGGQIAVQVPANAHMPSHAVARALADQEPYRSMFGAEGAPPDPVLAHVLEPEEYAQVLHELGFARQHVRLQVYPHVLPSTRHVVEWVRGTMLTRFAQRLHPDAFAAFVRDYERDLLAVLGDRQPHFFPFRRILMWGRLPD